MKSKLVCFIFAVLMTAGSYVFAFDQTITVPAEESKGVTLDLAQGKYRAVLAGGAVSLFLPMSPDYRWLLGLSMGVKAAGGQDDPDLGTLYFEPAAKAKTQADAENQALQAVDNGQSGTSLEFTLGKDSQVRFWVSDFDYTDNSGMIKVRVYTIE